MTFFVKKKSITTTLHRKYPAEAIKNKYQGLWALKGSTNTSGMASITKKAQSMANISLVKLFNFPPMISQSE